MSQRQVSPYQLGASRGVIFGIIFCIMFFCMVLSEQSLLLGSLAIALFVSVPMILFRMLRRTYIASDGSSSLYELWMQGFTIFICGSLITAVVTIIYMRWIEPTFIIDMLNNAATVYESTGDPQAIEIAKIVRQMIANHAVPSPQQLALQMIWLTTLTGSLLTLVVALLARLGAVPPKFKNSI